MGIRFSYVTREQAEAEDRLLAALGVEPTICPGCGRGKREKPGYQLWQCGCGWESEACKRQRERYEQQAAARIPSGADPDPT